MQKALLVISDFANYKKGDLIENTVTIASIISSYYAKFVIAVNVPNATKARTVEQKGE